MPEEWRLRDTGGVVVERVTLEEASAALGLPIAVPASLPSGFAFASAEVVRAGGPPGATLYFRDAEAGSAAIRLHVEAAGELPPASSERQRRVEVAGTSGRWTPGRFQLEWVADGVYRSLDSPGLGLGALLAIAGSIPADAAEEV
jgi:hypothetical protein